MITSVFFGRLTKASRSQKMMKDSGKTNTQVCPSCRFGVHEDDALYCKKCGTKLDIA